MVVQVVKDRWANRSYRRLGRAAFITFPAMCIAIILRPDTTLLGSIAAAVASTAIGGAMWAALSPMEVRLAGDEVIVINPFCATTRIPVEEVDSIEVATCLEFHLRDQSVVRAWGVEPASISRLLHRESSADRAAQDLRAAIANAVPTGDPPDLPTRMHAFRTVILAVALAAVCAVGLQLLAK